MKDDSDGMDALDRIESMVNSVSAVLGLTRRKTLASKANDAYAIVPDDKINFMRTVWLNESGTLLGWRYENVNKDNLKTVVEVHMVVGNVKYLVIEYSKTNKIEEEVDFSVTWAEGFGDAQITIAVLLNLDHPKQVVFE